MKSKNSVSTFKAIIDILESPIIVGMPMYTSFSSMWNDTSKHGIWNSVDTTSYPHSLWHATCIVGYDDSKEAFKVMNSWGDSLGDHGFYWAKYNVVEQGAFREVIALTTRDSAEIEGPDRLSDTTYFSVSNVPDGATCTWTVTPPHYTIGEFTIHNNGTPSICVTRDPQPTPMFNGLNTEQERIIIIPPVPDIGSVDVIISDGNDHSYHISKTLYSGVWFHSNALSKEKKFPYTLELWHTIYGLVRTQGTLNPAETIDTNGLPQGIYIILRKDKNGEIVEQKKIMIQ